MNTKKGIVTIVLAAVFLVSMTGMASATEAPLSVTWDFGNQTVMYRQLSLPDAEKGTTDIASGASVIWNESDVVTAVGGVPFAAKTWNGQLLCQTPAEDKNCTVEIGIYDGSLFTSKGKSAKVVLNDVLGNSYTLTGSVFTVPKDQWLAVRVNDTGNNPTSMVVPPAFTLMTDGSCFISYPVHTNYPVPELSTIVLMSVGLLALVGYVGLRRRKN